jgi:hypothetical protein
MKAKHLSTFMMALVVATGLLFAACTQQNETPSEKDITTSQPPKMKMTTPIPVTAENFAQAETAWNMRNWDKLRTGPGLFHYREPTPTGPGAPTVRMNWDTLYSNWVITVSDDHEFSVTLPESDLYIAVQVIDENGFSPYYIYEKGVEHKLKVDTDHAWVLFRTELKDRHSKEALAATHAAQDQIIISGIMEDVRYVMPNYDQDQLEKLRKAYKEEYLNAGIDLTYAKGPGEVDQHILDISHAAGFGGYPPEEGRSNIYSMSDNQPGDICLAVTFDDPKSKFFTSFTVYDADGYLIDANSHIKSDQWTPNDDGTITIHFNCGDDAVNNLSSNGETFNYTVRYYGVSREVMDGTIRPLKPEPVE